MKKCNVHIYCDGGVTGNGKEDSIGGFGTILDVGEDRIEFSGAFLGVTNNQMEMYAALVGLHYIHRFADLVGAVPFKVGTVILTSDSKYLTEGASKWVYGWEKRGWVTADKSPVKNQELWEHLHHYNRKYPTDWRWVKGHNGHDENERCDVLAGLAIKAAKAGNPAEFMLPADLGGALYV